MPLDFPPNPVDGQVYGNFYYSSAKGAWRSTTDFNSPSSWRNAIGTTATASGVPLTVQGIASQSANLQEWKNSSGATLASIDSTGSLTATGLTTSAATTLYAGGGALAIKAGATLDHAYLSIFARSASQSTRNAYIGYPSSGSTTLAIANEISGGAVSLIPGANGQVNLPAQTYFPGSVVQIKTMQMNTFTSVYAQDVTAIPGMNMTFAPKFSNSILLLTATVTGTSNYVCTYGFLKDGTNLSTLSNSNAYGSVYTSYYNDGATDGGMRPGTFSFSYSPGSTANATYYVGVSSSWAGGVYTTYINDRSGGDMRSYSSFTIMEIAQ